MRVIFAFLILFYGTVQSQMRLSIYFSKGSYEINFAEKLKIDSLLKMKGKYNLRIFGTCDVSGSQILNKKLSQNRANQFKEYIKTGSNVVLEQGLGY